MTTQLTKPAPSGALSTDLRQAAEKAADYARQSVPENTRRAYASDWKAFADWCEGRSVSAIPADPRVIASFIAQQADRLRPATLRRRLAAITKMHSLRGLPNPCSAEPVPATIKGIEATVGSRPVPKAPATLEVIGKLVTTCRTDTIDGIRNRAILLLGYAGAMRRSELVSLAVSDLAWKPEGVVITVRRSKTDQRGAGMSKAIPYVEGPFCAAKALKAWLLASGIEEGPVFRGFGNDGKRLRQGALSDQAVALIVKSAALQAGIDPEEYSGHSLRAGHVTEARAQGIADDKTMSVTGHQRVETLNMYDRRSNLFDKTSAGAVQSMRKPR